jgi:hypothetical protein
MKKNLIILGIIICSLAGVALPLTAQDSQPKKQERYSALAYLPTDAGPQMAGAGSTLDVDIVIQQYSTDAEVQELGQVLLSTGPEAVLQALRKKKPIGKVSLTARARVGQHLPRGSFDLKLIRSTRPAEGGRLVTAVADRPIGFLETSNAERSMDYPFGILRMQLKVKEEEEGEGTLIYAAKVKVIDKTEIEIENYGGKHGIGPVELKGIRRR